MRVRNLHSRNFGQSPELVGRRLDSLSARGDGLWPHERWPRMVLDQPLGVGASGGHGPIRYTVEEYEPGRQVVFRFTRPKGFHGTHSFTLNVLEDGCELRHAIEMSVSGPTLLTWHLVYRPLHDALLEDSLDKVESDLSGGEWRLRDLSLLVRFLRNLLARRPRRPS